MSEEEQRPPIRAGQAVIKAMEANPHSKAALARAILKLRMFAQAMGVTETPYQEAMQAFQEIFASLRDIFATQDRNLGVGVGRVFDSLRAEQERSFTELEAEIASASDGLEAELVPHGFESPQELEDWEALARMVEKEPDLLTLEEIYLWVIAWAEGEILRRRIARGELPV